MWNFACEEFSNVICKRSSAALCSLKASHINGFNLKGSYKFQVWDAGRNLKVNTFFFFVLMHSGLQSTIMQSKAFCYKDREDGTEG